MSLLRLVGTRRPSVPTSARPADRQQRVLAAAARPVIEGLERRQLLAAVVGTDLPDYAPGSTAFFSAYNDDQPGANFDFAAGEKVQFQVLRADGEPNNPPGHDPWRVVDGGTETYTDTDGVIVVADLDGAADGRIETSWYVHEQFLGAELELTAAGQESGASAAAQFRDGLDFTTFKLYAPQTFAAPSTLAPLVGFEIKTTSAADQFKKVDFFTWTGSTFSTNVTALRLYYKTFATAPTSGDWSAGSPGTLVSIQTGAGKNTPDGSGKIVIEALSPLTMTANTYYQFFIVADVKATAVNGNLLKLRFGQSNAIDFNGGKANPTTADTLGTATIDTNAPAVSSINRVDANPTNAASVGFTATFNELVSGVDAGDFALATSGVSGASITGVTGIGAATVLNGVSYYSSYSVTVNTGTGNGTIGLNFADNDTALDRAGHRVGGTGLGNGNFTGQVYTVQKSVATSLSADAATGTYGGTATLTATLSSGGLGVSGKQVEFSLDGNAVGSGTTDSFGVATLANVSLDGFGAGTYSGAITATFAGDATHLTSSGSNTLTVDKANATISVSGFSGTYDGTAKAASGSATGALGENLAGLDLGGSFTNAGTHSADWTYTDVTGNYNNASGSVTIQIDKATLAVAVTGYTGGTYDGLGHTQTVTVTGVGTEGQLFTDSLSGTNADSYSKAWSYTNTNYNDVSGTLAFVIDKATLAVVVTGYTGGTYDGLGHTQTVTVTGVGTEGELFTDSLSGTDADSYSKTWSYTSANYNDVSGTLAFEIGKADAVVVVEGTTVTYNGGSHGATGSATGVLGESLDGLVLGDSFTNAGTHGAIWTFTDVTGNYNDAGGSVTIQIDKADAVVVVSGFSGTYDASAKGASGSATGVLGEALAGLDLGDSFTNAGTHSANWSFTDVTGNYNDASGTVEIVINQAQAVLNWSDIGPITQGTSLDGLLGATSDVAGSWVYTIEGFEVDGSSVLVAGSYTIVATFTPDSDNYLGGTVENSLTVQAAGVEVIATLVQENMNLAMNGHFSILLTASGGGSLQTGVFEDLGIVVGSYTAYVESVQMASDGISVLAVFRMTTGLRDALADMASSGDEDVTLSAGPGRNIFVNLSVGLTGTYDGEEISGSATMNFFVNSSLRALLAELQSLMS